MCVCVCVCVCVCDEMRASVGLSKRKVFIIIGKRPGLFRDGAPRLNLRVLTTNRVSEKG